MTELDDLVDDMAVLLGAPCTLEDPDFQLIGFSDHRISEGVDEVRQRSILERRSNRDVRNWFHRHGIREATGPVRIPADPERGVAPRLCVPARHLGRIHAYFWLLEGAAPAPQDLWPQAMRIAESAAALLNVAEHRQALRDAAYRDIVEGTPNSPKRSAHSLAAAAGIDVHDPVTCVVVRRPGLRERLSSLSERPGVLWVREERDVSAALVRADALRPARNLSDVLDAVGLRRRLPSLDEATYVGVGPTSSGLQQLASSRVGARVALRVSGAAQVGNSVRWDDLGPLTLLGVAADEDLAWALIGEQLGGFLRDGPPELVETARVFLDEGRSATRAAHRLALHRQTVYNRISQVERLSGCDLRTGSDSLRLHLALVLFPYIDRVV